MESYFKVSGLSFKKTPINIRERCALNEDESKRLIRLLTSFADVADVLVLSTCNRTEIYYNSEKDLTHEIAMAISSEKGIAGEELTKHLFCMTDNGEAVRHLFHVAIGLDAQVVGDIHIANQVKKAYQWSADENAAGPFLHRLMHSVFYTSKRVVQETSFRDGAASVPYAAKELIEDITDGLQSPRILILGLGEIGQDVCRNYAGSDKDITLTNRTAEKAELLGAECGFKTISFDEALHSLASFDVIVSSVSHSEPIITRAMVDKFQLLQHKFFIDLSVPRSVETRVEDIPGVLLYNIDNIQSKATEVLGKRMAAIPDVKSIISESLTDFHAWSKEMIVSPTIKKLKNALESIRQEEIKRYLKEADGRDHGVVEAVTKSMMQKIIKLPVLQLKAACKRGEAETLIDVLNDLFDLEKQSVSS